MVKEEGLYNIKRADKLPNRGNGNLLYSVKGPEEMKYLYRWLSTGGYERITLGSGLDYVDVFGPNGVIVGGVIHLPLLGPRKYYVWATSYIIAGVKYDEPVDGIVTLSESDDALDRFDVFFIQNDGVNDAFVGVLPGELDDNPVKPSIDLLTQVEVGFRLVLNNETTPGEITTNVIYNENLGAPTEWTLGTSGGNPQEEFQPYTGIYCYYLPSQTNTDWSTVTPVTYDSTTKLNFAIYLYKAFDPARSRIRIRFGDSAGNFSSWVTINYNSSEFNFDGSLIQQWQLVSVDLSDFNNLPSELAIFQYTSSRVPQLNLDWIVLQGGIGEPPAQGTYLGLSDTTDNTYVGKAGYVPIVNLSATGLTLGPPPSGGVTEEGTPGVDRQWRFTSETTGHAAAGQDTIDFTWVDGTPTDPVGAQGTNSITIGQNAYAKYTNGLSIGTEAVNYGSNGIVIGPLARIEEAGTQNSLAIGYGAKIAAGIESVALGALAGFRSGGANNAIFIGYQAGSYDGTLQTLVGTGAVSIGGYSQCLGDGVALGYSARAYDGVAIGDFVDGTARYSIAIGNGVLAATNAIAIGASAGAAAAGSVAIGGFIQSSDGQYSTALGPRIGAGPASYGEVKLGLYGTDYTANSTSAFDAADRILTVGIGASGGAPADGLVGLKSGAWAIPKYGIGTFTGTAAYTLQVDSSGNIIEGSTAPTLQQVVDAGNTTLDDTINIGQTVFADTATLALNGEYAQLTSTADNAYSLLQRNSLNFRDTSSNITTLRAPQSASGNYNVDFPSVTQDSTIATVEDNGVYRVKVSLSAAQIKAIGTTPITAISGAGAGTIIQPISAFAVNTYGTVAFDTNALNIRTSGATNPLFVFDGGLLDATATETWQAGKGTVGPNDLITNTDIVIDGTDSVATGDSTVDVYITYEVITL